MENFIKNTRWDLTAEAQLLPVEKALKNLRICKGAQCAPLHEMPVRGARACTLSVLLRTVLLGYTPALPLASAETVEKPNPSGLG